MTVQGALADMVSETTLTQSTDPKVLEGPAVPFVAFRDQFADGALVCFVEEQLERDGNDEIIGRIFEAGYATLAYGPPDTLTTATIVRSTNGNSPVNWGPGTKTIWCAAPGELLMLLDEVLTAGKAGRIPVVNETSTGFRLGAPAFGQQAASELTVASGSVTPTRARHTIDTESDAATDDLTNAVTTNIPDGGLLMLSGADAGRVTTIKHAATGDGEFHMADAADFALAGSATILFERRGADWYEVSRSKRPVTVGDMANLAEDNLLMGDASNRPVAHGLGTGLETSTGPVLQVAPAFTPGGMYSNIRASRPTAATVDFDADFVSVFDSSGNGRRLFNVDLTLNMATAGAGGLSTGSEASATWYFFHVIYDPDADEVDGIFDVSATAPTLPSGFTLSKCYGAVYNDGSSNFLAFTQRNDDVQYTAGRELSNGAIGTPGSAWATLGVTALVPTDIAARIKIYGYSTSGAGGQALAFAPNSSYSPAFSGNVDVAPIQFGATTVVASGPVSEMMLESTNIYGVTSATTRSKVLGYTLNL